MTCPRLGSDAWGARRPRAVALLRTGLALLLLAGVGRAGAESPDADLEAQRAAGRAALVEGREAAARAAYMGVLRTAPQDPEAIHNLAALAAARGDPRRAEALYARLLDVPSEADDALFNIGVVRRDAGDLAGAVASFTEVVRQRPHYTRGRLALAEALLEVGRPEQVEAIVAVAAKQVKGDPLPWILKAQAALALGQLEATRRATDEAARRDPESVEVAALRAALAEAGVGPQSSAGAPASGSLGPPAPTSPSAAARPPGPTPRPATRAPLAGLFDSSVGGGPGGAP